MLLLDFGADSDGTDSDGSSGDGVGAMVFCSVWAEEVLCDRLVMARMLDVLKKNCQNRLYCVASGLTTVAFWAGSNGKVMATIILTYLYTLRHVLVIVIKERSTLCPTVLYDTLVQLVD
jgi:hypothetical protein